MGNQLCNTVNQEPYKIKRFNTINTTSEIGHEIKYSSEQNHIRHSANIQNIHVKLQQPELEYYEIELPPTKQSKLKKFKPKQSFDQQEDVSKYNADQLQDRHHTKIIDSQYQKGKTSSNKTEKSTISVEYKQLIIKTHPSNIKISPISSLSFVTGHSQVFSLNDELIYEGELKNSKFDGFGKMYQQSQLFYEGEFKNGLFDGWGITQNYIGEWRQGLYDGYGIYQQFSENNKQLLTFYYEGYFQNGLYSGSGVLIKSIKLPLKQLQKIHNKNGIIEFLNSEIQHGLDIIKKYKAQQIYIGQFSNGYRHGFGRLFTQKMEFSGQFSHNLYHGLGTIFNRTNEGKKVHQSVFKMGKQFKQ